METRAFFSLLFSGKGGWMLTERILEWFIRANQKSTQQRLQPHELERIDDMYKALAQAPPSVKPSLYWEELNKMNLAQLKEEGFENFKRTIALNYFTWARILPWDNQIVFLCRQLGFAAIFRALGHALRFCRKKYFSSLIQSFSYGLLTSLLWEYILAGDHSKELLALREPELGSPPFVATSEGIKISQDLGNSILEYESFRQGLPAADTGTVLELGGGYGRNAFVVLKLNPHIQYILVDIPPALWVAEQYLSRLFPERRIFRYRNFERFEEIVESYNRADLVFLLSSQLSVLPPGSADLIINISSLHEMRRDQIAYYFQKFDKVLKPGGHAYIKERKKAKVLFENITLTEEDYPTPSGWKKIMSRTAQVQTRFFETLFRKAPE
jgi:putative sugar O-methyltransferase